MQFNTFLYRFGLDPNDFDNVICEPIICNDGYIYYLIQKTDIRVCPHCGSNNCYIHDYYTIEINCNSNQHIKDTLLIKKVRFKCNDCLRSFTNDINGIDRNNSISKQTIDLIIKDFFNTISFSQIANNYGVSVSRIIQIFDKEIPVVYRRPLPKTLCIDEKRFNEEINQKYCCILYNPDNNDIVDVIKNRQLAYLEEYFNNIPLRERENVKFFVSDMYDGYATICHKYLPNATHYIDLFHIIRLMSQAVNSLRVYTMNKTVKGTMEYNFMKAHWKSFLCRKENIADKFYYHKVSKQEHHYDYMVDKCIKLNNDLLLGYLILQDLYHYYQKRNYNEALQFIDHISKRLIDSLNPYLTSVGLTYKKWRSGIANTFAKSQNLIHPSNSIAENSNNHIEVIIRIAYGYHNFERFRKRVLLIRTYKKKDK